jgi:hypothetical protein
MGAPKYLVTEDDQPKRLGRDEFFWDYSWELTRAQPKNIMTKTPKSSSSS